MSELSDVSQEEQQADIVPKEDEEEPAVAAPAPAPKPEPAVEVVKPPRRCR